MSAMTTLSLGLFLWFAAHLFKRIAPNIRARMGASGKAIIAATIIGSIILMIIGYRGIDQKVYYFFPYWSWYMNNALMIIAVFLMDIGRTQSVIRTHIRHPMLLGVFVWSIAHLLVNGDNASLILFGGLAMWSIIEMLVINKSEGAWIRPDKGKWKNDLKTLGIALVIYGVIVGIHYWVLGYSVLAIA